MTQRSPFGWFSARLYWPALFSILLLPVWGCTGLAHRTTGDVVISYATEHLVPFMMAGDDVDAACETGVSMGAFLGSFGRVNASSDLADLVASTAAGMCAEARAWEEELRYLRALRAGQVTEVHDARIEQVRWQARSAHRFYRAFLSGTHHFGELDEVCPALDKEEELYYFLTLATGLLAIMHDRASQGAANVPMRYLNPIARASCCLDSVRWWGMPSALRAVIWLTVPGAAPSGADPWKLLEDAALQGDRAGVRLARAFQIQALSALGQEEVLGAALRDYAKALENPPDEQWRLLDRYGTLMVLHESDKIWTSEKGHRTPAAQFGEIPHQEVLQVDEGFLEDLDLDDLE